MGFVGVCVSAYASHLERRGGCGWVGEVLGKEIWGVTSWVGRGALAQTSVLRLPVAGEFVACGQGRCASHISRHTHTLYPDLSLCFACACLLLLLLLPPAGVRDAAAKEKRQRLGKGGELGEDEEDSDVPAAAAAAESDSEDDPEEVRVCLCWDCVCVVGWWG